jgi:two-component system, LytTR family, response regulator
MIRSVIIEDEPKTREGLEYLLEKYCPEVKVCGKAGDFEQGFVLVKESNPSLVFMDIQLNAQEGTGIDLIQTLNLSNCAVIFISGYKDYAVEAFRLNAADYLLKPIRINQLVESVEKAKRFLEVHNSPANGVTPETKNDTFHIPSQNGFVLVRQQEIIRCEADGAYTHFYVKGRSERITATINIGQIEAKLGPEFLRVHKSHIINRSFIASYSKTEGLLVRMPDNAVIPVSRAQKEAFFKWLV